MAKTHTILQVFVASPNDVSDERTLLSEVVAEFNNTWGARNGVMLELLKWETHSRPGFGADAQDVINKHIGDDYDIFIGIMWGRFGSQTERAESGTEEEFNRAYSRLSDSPEGVQILFYFKDAGIPPSKIDPSQLQKVQEFKQRIADEYGGYYRTFESTEQFQSMARMHLSKIVQDWLDANNPVPASPPKNKTALEFKAAKMPTDNPLSNLAALELEEDEDGIIELVEQATESMAEVASVVKRMSIATIDLGEKFTKRTTEANDPSTGGKNMKAAKRISNKAADDLEMFVKIMSIEIKEFNKHSVNAMETFGNIAMMSERDLDQDPDDIAAARASIQQYTTTISNSAESLENFRKTIFDLPRMTTSFNRARKRAVAIMDDLLNQLRIAASQSQDIDSLLARLDSTT